MRIANNSIYGLSGAVFGSEDRALAVARRIRTGTFSINGGMYFSPDSPFGGYKQSGIGREMGDAGLEEFLERKTFATVVWSSHESRWRASASSRSPCTASSRRRARCSPSGAPTSSRSSTPITGDPQRGLRQTGLLRVEGDPNPNIEHANRGKRSIGLDMSVPEGREVLLELAKRADVFLTSFLPGHRQKFGIDVDDIRAVNPKIIYARGSALGPRGEESVKGGYDMTAFWCRAGTAATITPPGMPGMIGPPGPAYGDTISRHQPRGRDRRGAAQAGAHRRAVGRRRLAARQRACGRWATPSR